MTALLDIAAPGAPRPRLPVQLIALDLDGTCLDWDQHLDTRIRDAIRATVISGVPVVVATGRMYPATLRWAEEMHASGPLLCYQGASVRELPLPGQAPVEGARMGPLVEEFPVDAGVALAVLREARANNWHLQAYQDERLLCERDRPEVRYYVKIAEVPFTVIDDLEPLLVRGSVKLVFVILDPAEAQRCEDVMRARFGDVAHVIRSLPQFVEVTSLRASKGLALRRLCGRMGIDMARTAAVGDAPNDIDMLAAAGFSVAVDTDDPRLLAVADALCAPPTRAGVADVLAALVPAVRRRPR